MLSVQTVPKFLRPDGADGADGTDGAECTDRSQFLRPDGANGADGADEVEDLTQATQVTEKDMIDVKDLTQVTQAPELGTRKNEY